MTPLTFSKDPDTRCHNCGKWDVECIELGDYEHFVLLCQQCILMAALAWEVHLTPKPDPVT